jgi:hypothetical protein
MTPKQLEVLQQMEQAHPLLPAPKAPSPAPAHHLPEDVFWEGLYEQYGSPELRREFLPYQYFSKLPLLSTEQNMALLIQEMQETLAFSSPDERAKLHADWERGTWRHLWRCICYGHAILHEANRDLLGSRVEVHPGGGKHPGGGVSSRWG